MVLVAISFYFWQTEIECVMQNTLNDASTLVNAILSFIFIFMFIFIFILFLFFFCFLYFILFYGTLDLQTSNWKEVEQINTNRNKSLYAINIFVGCSQGVKTRGIAVSGSCFWIFHSKNKIENSISQSFWHPRHRHSRHGPVQPAQTALRPCCCYPCWRLKTTKLLTTQDEWVWHRQTQWSPLPPAFPLPRPPACSWYCCCFTPTTFGVISNGLSICFLALVVHPVLDHFGYCR